MQEARELILAALEQAPEINASGSTSLIAIAARALDASASITRQGMADALGLHSSLIIATLVTADLAGDTDSRRQLGRRLFSTLELRGRPPELTLAGQLAVCVFGLERLLELEPLLEGATPAVLALARAGLAGQPVEPATLRLVEESALRLQQTKVVPIERGAKTKLGIPADEAARRHGAQALRAVLMGLRDSTASGHLSSTVTGEVAACLILMHGLEPATEYLLALAEKIQGLPPEQAVRSPGN